MRLLSHLYQDLISPLPGPYLTAPRPLFHLYRALISSLLYQDLISQLPGPYLISTGPLSHRSKALISLLPGPYLTSTGPLSHSSQDLISPHTTIKVVDGCTISFCCSISINSTISFNNADISTFNLVIRLLKLSQLLPNLRFIITILSEQRHLTFSI